MSEQLKELRKNIEELLDECSAENTPTVCELISTSKGRQKIVVLIEEKVISAGMSIGESINSIEMDYNNNLID